MTCACAARRGQDCEIKQYEDQVATGRSRREDSHILADRSTEAEDSQRTARQYVCVVDKEPNEAFDTHGSVLKQTYQCWPPTAVG
jgi:hypothetical protein